MPFQVSPTGASDAGDSTSTATPFGGDAAGGGTSRLAVSLVTELRFDDEGEVVALQHMCTPHSSMLLCATQRWRIHG